MYPTLGSLASPRSGLRRGASTNTNMLICKFFLISSNKSPTQCTSGSLDQNHRAVQTITSQNRFADFRNSSFPMILDPQTTADGVSFFVFSSVSSIFLPFSPGFVPNPLDRD